MTVIQLVGVFSRAEIDNSVSCLYTIYSLIYRIDLIIFSIV